MVGTPNLGSWNGHWHIPNPKKRAMTSLEMMWWCECLTPQGSITGWWYTYPSEKWWSSSVGIILPNIWNNNPHVPNHQPDNIIPCQNQWMQNVSKCLCLRIPPATIRWFISPLKKPTWDVKSGEKTFHTVEPAKSDKPPIQDGWDPRNHWINHLPSGNLT